MKVRKMKEKTKVKEMRTMNKIITTWNMMRFWVSIGTAFTLTFFVITIKSEEILWLQFKIKNINLVYIWVSTKISFFLVVSSGHTLEFQSAWLQFYGSNDSIFKGIKLESLRQDLMEVPLLRIWPSLCLKLKSTFNKSWCPINISRIISFLKIVAW